MNDIKIIEPIIIIGAPRSGTTLLFSILSSSHELWSLYRETHDIFEGSHNHPSKKNWTMGNKLDENDAPPELIRWIHSELKRKVINYQRIFPNMVSAIDKKRGAQKIFYILGQFSKIFKNKKIRIVEKTPKNCLRIPFINRIFPDALYIFITRDGRANVSALIEGWQTKGRFETYDLPVNLNIHGYEGKKWKFVLPPGWQKFVSGKVLAEVCAFQYISCNEEAIRSFKNIPNNRILKVKFEDLITEPIKTIKKICNFAKIKYEKGIKKCSENLPVVNITSRPSIDNDWQQKHREDIEKIIPLIKPTMEALGYQI